MKKLFLFATLLCLSTGVYAQSAPSFSLDELKSKEDMNPLAQKAISYILSTPADTAQQMRKDAKDYLMIWMEKTEDYSFAIDNIAVQLLEENKEEGMVFFAALAEAMMNDKNITPQKANEAAAKRLIQYSNASRNKLQPGTALTKMTEADKKGKLKEYLDSITQIK